MAHDRMHAAHVGARSRADRADTAPAVPGRRTLVDSMQFVDPRLLHGGRVRDAPRQHIHTMSVDDVLATGSISIVLSVPDAYPDRAAAQRDLMAGARPDRDAVERFNATHRLDTPADAESAGMEPEEWADLARPQYSNNHEIPRAANEWASYHQSLSLAGDSSTDIRPGIAVMDPSHAPGLTTGDAVIWRTPQDLANKIALLHALIQQRCRAIGCAYPTVNIALFGHGGTRYLGGHGEASDAQIFGNGPKADARAREREAAAHPPHHAHPSGHPVAPEPVYPTFDLPSLFAEHQQLETARFGALSSAERDRLIDLFVRHQAEERTMAEATIASVANAAPRRRFRYSNHLVRTWNADDRIGGHYRPGFVASLHYQNRHRRDPMSVGAPAAAATAAPSATPTTPTVPPASTMEALGDALAPLMASGGHVMFFACSTALDSAEFHDHHRHPPLPQGERAPESPDRVVLGELQEASPGNPSFEVAGHTTRGPSLDNPHMRFFFGGDRGGTDIGRTDLITDEQITALASQLAEAPCFQRSGGSESDRERARIAAVTDAAKIFHDREAWLLPAASLADLRVASGPAFERFLQNPFVQNRLQTEFDRAIR